MELGVSLRARPTRMLSAGCPQPRAGVEGVSELPTGTVTFLFTDIEGSTCLWQEHPEAMRAASARHDELVRTAIEMRDEHCGEDDR